MEEKCLRELQGQRLPGEEIEEGRQVGGQKIMKEERLQALPRGYKYEKAEGTR